MYLRLGPYQEVLQGILVSLQIDEGIIKIIGKSGAGKSALCKQLHDDLQASGQPAVLFSEPPASAVALQNAITGQLQLNTGNFTRALSAWLHARDAVRKPLVLIVDDAQNLDPPTFSALRMLCNIQDSAHSLVRIVLCGNDELDARLASPALRAVTQFISHNFTLPYLTQGQVGDFCQAWWQQNGGDVKPFAERTLVKLHHDTKGKPGLLCARLEQQNTGAEPIVARIPDAAAVLALGDVQNERKPRRHRMFVLIIVLLLAGVTGAYLYLMQTLQAADANTAVDAAAP
ncbi:MAG: AAA family ATPase, partial [Pseudomonadota bacterium]|nr:AAA family ATPase [Pseudomonadota bacterium]